MATLEKIRDLLSEQMNIDKEKITKSTKVLEDLKADSLDLVEMLTALEDEFNISVSDEEAKKLVTVGDIAAFIDSKTK